MTSNSLPSFINNTSSERSKEININIKTISVDISNVDSLSGNTDDQQDFNTIIFPEDVPFISGDKIFYSYSNGSGLVGIKTGSYKKHISVKDYGVDSKKISSSYKNGILTITLPKHKEAKPQTIQVAMES